MHVTFTQYINIFFIFRTTIRWLIPFKNSPLLIEFNIFTSPICSRIEGTLRKQSTENQTLEFYIENKKPLGQNCEISNFILKKQTNKQKQNNNNNNNKNNRK